MTSLTTDLALRDLLEATNRLRETVLHLAALVTEDAKPRTITVEDLATVTGLHANQVRIHIDNGLLPGRKIGGRYVIGDLEFDALRRGDWRPTAATIRAKEPKKMLHQVPRPTG